MVLQGEIDQQINQINSEVANLQTSEPPPPLPPPSLPPLPLLPVVATVQLRHGRAGRPGAGATAAGGIMEKDALKKVKDVLSKVVRQHTPLRVPLPPTVFCLLMTRQCPAPLERPCPPQYANLGEQFLDGEEFDGSLVRKAIKESILTALQ